MSKLKKCVKFSIRMILGFFSALVITLLGIILYGLYLTFNGWWGLFLCLCLFGLFVATFVVISEAIWDLQMWLDETEEDY